MPTYEYICKECGEKIEIKATISEKEKGLKLNCPKCGSGKMIQVFGRFFVFGSAKGGSSPSMCGPSSGPGCCG